MLILQIYVEQHVFERKHEKIMDLTALSDQEKAQLRRHKINLN